MTATLTLPSPAKLNLFLHITGRRADGYHELQTVFQLLDWGDTLSFAPDDSGDITLLSEGLDLPADDNLVYRAARHLAAADSARHGRSRPDRGVTIRLQKRVPAGGGLGGGSSNAATTLLALNHLWRLRLSRDELAAIGAELGADVPVFIAGHSAWAEGIGEHLTPLELPDRWYLIVVPACHVSTAEVFSHGQLTRNSAPIKMAAFFRGAARNDCQDLVRALYPDIDKVLKSLDKFGEARLTGTGACVFVGFENAALAEAAQAQLPQGWRSHVARGINRSPVHGMLAQRQ